MAVSSSCFFDEACRLMAVESAGEMIHRNAISRAYYSAYHVALRLADRLSSPPVSAYSGGSHKKVSDFYCDYSKGTLDENVKYRKVGINLLQLHSQRVKADYKLDEDVFFQDAESVLKRVECLINDLVGLGAAA